MIDRPGVHLKLSRIWGDEQGRSSISPSATAPPHSARAAGLLAHHQAQWGEEKLPVELNVFEEIPPHSGLGSGTQLSLAILEALQRLRGETPAHEDLIRACSRGERSAIGLHGYAQGGFLIDAGHAVDQELGEIACRIDFPSAWRVVLLKPQGAVGLHAGEEVAAFQKLSPMSKDVTGRLCRLALTEILPALQTARLDRFAPALYEYGQLVGEFFTPTQGGVFSSPLVRDLAKLLPDVEQSGMAQSSWGPAVALFAQDDSHARQLEDQVQRLLPPGSVQCQIVSPLNSGRSLQEQFNCR